MSFIQTNIGYVPISEIVEVRGPILRGKPNDEYYRVKLKSGWDVKVDYRLQPFKQQQVVPNENQNLRLLVPINGKVYDLPIVSWVQEATIDAWPYPVTVYDHENLYYVHDVTTGVCWNLDGPCDKAEAERYLLERDEIYT